MTDEWPVAGMDIVRWQPALDLNLDIVLELGMQMRQDQVDGFQKRGTKVSRLLVSATGVSTLFSCQGMILLFLSTCLSPRPAPRSS